ncbi:hypothetical protein [Grimontia sedimenti]|nr:hypothetical protein [Grimontia sedimenti]
MTSNIDAQDALKVLICEGIQMLEYVARHGELSIDPKIAAGVYRAKERIESKQWKVEDEILLLQCYDQLAKQIYPVTLESLKAVKPPIKRGKWISPSAAKVINWYRRYTVITLLILLVVQMYSLFGHTLTEALYKESELTSKPMIEWSPETKANYRLLAHWNSVWLFGGQFASDDESADSQMVNLSAQLIAAESVLQMLQNYVLPLFYGLLGAFIFVLRSLLNQVRTLTYTSSREVGYRLRLTLGCLAGMITGWLMKPDMGEMALSPMAVAFLSGYSIEVLFTLLDRLIDQVRQNQPSPVAKSRMPD